MTGDSFDFYPVNMPAGPEFIGVLLIMWLVAVAVGKAVQSLVITALDRTRHQRIVLQKKEPGPYRSWGGESQSRFTIGSLPMADELLGLAYLTHGVQGMTDAILAEGVAAGWLVPQEDGYLVGKLNDGASEAASRLHGKLGPGQLREATYVRYPAWRVAQDLEPSVREDLEREGMLRASSTTWWGRVAFLAVVAIPIVIGFIRSWRGMSLGHSVGFLMLELVALIVFGVILSRSKDRSDQGTAYVDWVTSVTESVRDDVAEDGSSDDLVLAAAISGLAIAPGLADLAAFAEKSGTTNGFTMFASNSSSSSTSSSSGCGGGSSGGGGGCGG